MKQITQHLMKHFSGSIAISVIGLVAMLFYGGVSAAFLTLVLAILEVSLSFDNAVVNASVLKDMDEKWKKRFLTWGILIAVFGMRLVFPVAIVSVATGLGPFTVFDMALHRPDEYAHHLTQHHAMIVSFGGMFLLMVFLNYFVDDDKDIHWIHEVETHLARLGKLQSIQIVLAMILLLITAGLHGDDLKHKVEVLVAGFAGLMTYIIVDSITAYMEEKEAEMLQTGAKAGGLALFIYLEILDASFSFDGVIGAFAITKDVIIIMIGLGIGALFVRSLTLYLVKEGTLDELHYLEHGAHYAIGALAVIMLLGTKYHISEVFTGLIGVVLIYLSAKASIKENEAEALKAKNNPVETTEAPKQEEAKPVETVENAVVIEKTTEEAPATDIATIISEVTVEENAKQAKESSTAKTETIEAEVIQTESQKSEKDEKSASK